MTGTDASAPMPSTRPAVSGVPSHAAEAALQESLRQLAALVTGGLGLRDVLAHVATFAVRAIPRADGAGVTLLSGDSAGQVQVLAASHPFVAEIDEIQYSVLNEGPCITAALEGRTVRSGSLGGERLWPRFGPRVGRLGVHSALSLPLLLSERAVGAINVYSREKDAFDDRAEQLGELFATPAAVAVHNAQILARAQELTMQLQAALSSRPIIDQAIGILRARNGGSAEEAFGKLRSMSQADHVKLVDVARHIVDEAVRRAHARHAQP